MQRSHGCPEIRCLFLRVSSSRPCAAFSGPKDGRKDRRFSFLFKMKKSHTRDDRVQGPECCLGVLYYEMVFEKRADYQDPC